MEQKKQKIVVAACLAAFLLIGALSVVFSKFDSNEWTDADGSPVIISEILSSNLTYPSPDGQHLDFIEVHNLSAGSVDISGFMLSDDMRSIGYTFPAGTVLPAYGYAVCWCKPDSGDSRYANFGISRKNAETLYLYNTANVVIDQKEVPLTSANTPLIRVGKDQWEEGSFATPGYPNTEEGYAQWLHTAPGGDTKVIITEVMTDNSCVTTAPGIAPCDWVELTNTGTAPAVLTGAYLSNDPADPLKWQIPDLTIAPGDSAVVYCVGSSAAEGEAIFALSKAGCAVALTSQLGNTLSRVDCPALPADHSWALHADGSYQITDRPTPGAENSEVGYTAWLASVGTDQAAVAITEVMVSNRSTVLSQAGVLCDWVELTNTGSTSVHLHGLYLSDDPDQRGKWPIGDLMLEAGASVVIPCVGAYAAAGEADFALSSDGCTLILSGSVGNVISQVTCPGMEPDRVWAMQPDGSYRISDLPTPGLANTEANALAYRSSQLPMGELAITEVMPSNASYLIQSDGNYYDWIELTNISGHSIELSDYCLSKDADNLTGFALPSRTLAPGGRVTIICSAQDGLVGKYIQAPFTLSADECWVYVTHKGGTLSDYLRISQVPDGYSAGRRNTYEGVFYFDQPTPGRANTDGTALISQTPQALTTPGIYNDVTSVLVELTGAGTLHYTTDGSVPTPEDPVYTGPLALTSTTVLRVAGFEAGKLRSKVLTASYVINENHTLPVLSLAADPAALFGANGIYNQVQPFDEEITCNLSLFESDRGFSIDGGLEMMATNTAYPQKKSMKVNFRGRYGSSVLGYPVFGEETGSVFEALCLQAGSEQGQTLFRDELFTQLCLDFTDSVPARHYKFCVLYVNGQYYGIYTLKEDISEMLYSQANGVAESLVTMAEEPPVWGSELYQLAQYCREADMSDPADFAYFSDRVDTENLIDWMILQGYCCNDSIARDLRYFRAPETGNRWQLGFFDLDGGFTERTGFESVLTTAQPYAYLALTRSITQNPETRQAFLERLGQALDTTLSAEHVLARIGEFEALLVPEIPRERARWGGDAAVWQADVDRLRTYLTRYDHEAMLLQSLREYIGLTDTEAAALFGR